MALPVQCPAQFLLIPMDGPPENLCQVSIATNSSVTLNYIREILRAALVPEGNGSIVLSYSDQACNVAS